jgi:apolipoprotein N-acyltransferase
MLRATNTGATAIIDASGRVADALPFLAAGALTGQVQGMQGTTPFIRWGNGPAVGLALLIGLAAVTVARRRHASTVEVGT